MQFRCLPKLCYLVVLIVLVACNSKEGRPSPEDLVYHHVEGLRGAFPLPKSYVPVSKTELANSIRSSKQEAIQAFLRSSGNQPQAYFSQVFAPNGFVSIYPSKAKIPIKRAYSNYFVKLIESEVYNVSSKVLHYEIVENKMLSFNRTKAFQLSIQSTHDHGEFLTTYYLITTNHESLIVIDTTKGESEVKDAVATYILKNA